MEARDFKFAKFAVWGLLICTGVLTFAGVMSLFGDMFEGTAGPIKTVCILAFGGIAVFALAVCQAAAACAIYLKPGAARNVAWVIAIVTALVSVAGVYLGDAVLNNHPASLPPIEAMICGAVALAMTKPAMSAIIMSCEMQAGVEAEARDALLTAKDERIAALERELQAARSELARIAVRPLENKAETTLTPPRGTARRDDHRPRPAMSRRGVPSLPLTEEELLLAVNTIVERDGAKVVSLATVAREAERLFDRTVPKKRVEEHPKRHEIFAAVKAAA